LILSRHSPLKVIKGSKHRSFRLGEISIVPASESNAPFSTAIKVVEEDTWLVLSAKPVLREEEAHPIRVMTDLVEQEALSPGNVLRKGANWKAVIYDLDQEPICRTEWIERAMHQILDLADEHDKKTISLPIFGVQHSRLTIAQSLDAMIKAITDHRPQPGVKILLRIHDNQLGLVQQKLEASAV
jgi:hypothetical protein